MSYSISHSFTRQYATSQTHALHMHPALYSDFKKQSGSGVHISQNLSHRDTLNPAQLRLPSRGWLYHRSQRISHDAASAAAPQTTPQDRYDDPTNHSFNHTPHAPPSLTTQHTRERERVAGGACVAFPYLPPVFFFSKIITTHIRKTCLMNV